MLLLLVPGLSVDGLDASGTAESDVNDALRRKIHLLKERLGADGQRLRGKDGGEYKTPVTQQQVGGGHMPVITPAAWSVCTCSLMLCLRPLPV